MTELLPEELWKLARGDWINAGLKTFKASSHQQPTGVEKASHWRPTSVPHRRRSGIYSWLNISLLVWIDVEGSELSLARHVHWFRRVYYLFEPISASYLEISIRPRWMECWLSRRAPDSAELITTDCEWKLRVLSIHFHDLRISLVLYWTYSAHSTVIQSFLETSSLFTRKF